MELHYTTIERLVVKCQPDEVEKAFQRVPLDYHWISQKPIWKDGEVSRIKLTFERVSDTPHPESSAP